MEVPRICPRNKSMLELEMLQSAKYIESIIQHMIEKNIEMSNIAINIGANDGITLDLLHLIYLNHNYDGLCIEADNSTFKKLENNLPKKIKKINSFITPYNILNIIDKFNNLNIDIISIDIDSFDYSILEQIITLNPKIIIIELNENVPPGITYYAKYREDYDYSRHGSYQLFGCSLDAVTELAKKYSYSLLKMEWNNCVLINNKFSNLFNLPLSNIEAYDSGYYYRKNREKVFYWKGDEAICREMTLPRALDYLKNFFAKDLDKIFLNYSKI